MGVGNEPSSAPIGAVRIPGFTRCYLFQLMARDCRIEVDYPDLRMEGREGRQHWEVVSCAFKLIQSNAIDSSSIP